MTHDFFLPEKKFRIHPSKSENKYTCLVLRVTCYIISDFIEAQQRITQIEPFDPILETTTDLAQVAHEGFQKFCQDCGEEAARDLLTLFSVKKFNEIAPANYGFLIQEIEKRRQQTQ